MTDNTELKRLARRVIDIEALDGGEPIGEAWGEFEAAATPAAVLALIVEIEFLTESRQEAREERNKIGDRHDALEVERDQLKAESDRLTSLLKSWRDQAAENNVSANQLRAENAGLKTGYEAYERVNAELKAEVEALLQEREGKVLVPVIPSDGLLMSMAVRSDHALGCPGYYDQKGLGRPNNGVSHARMLECALADMRKLHEEVVGTGFYSAEKEAEYLAMAKAVQP